MTEAARVYDLDGTLVRLRVDWDAAASDAAAVYRDAGVPVDREDGTGLWELLERAPDHGLVDAVEGAIAAHEREGAARSERLEAADDLAALSVPVGVCSLNCEDACRIALERHGLLDHVDAVVGRDSVAEYKPHPEPLLEAVRSLSVDPSEALFIGDTERDEVTARRAGTRFEYVEGYPRDRA